VRCGVEAAKKRVFLTQNGSFLEPGLHFVIEFSGETIRMAWRQSSGCSRLP